MEIDFERITPYQKLIIARGLCDYQYIMEHREDRNPEFKKVYYDFYLSARWRTMTNQHNQDVYFEKLYDFIPSNNSLNDLMDIINCFRQNMHYEDNTAYEFSIASKLLHTKNPNTPIYDRKIRERLSSEEEIAFQWQIPNRISGALRGTTDEEKIRHDWTALCNWYEELFVEEGSEWIEWFDTNFPCYTHISRYKKIDFIIFATTP